MNQLNGNYPHDMRTQKHIEMEERIAKSVFSVEMERIAQEIMNDHVRTTRKFGYLLFSGVVLLIVALFMQDFLLLHLLHNN